MASTRIETMKFELLTEYCYERDDPNWLEYHIASTVGGIAWMGYTKAQKRALREREHKRILEFCELMENPEMVQREAEAEVWPESAKFYKEFEKERRRLARLEAERLKANIEPEPMPKAKPRMRLSNKLYLERELSQRQRDKLLSKGYSRLKISPFGTSGAAYYWVRRRYNESKEHAFFCYILEAELKRHVQKVKLNVNSGPDAVVEHDGRKYCFDVETGKSLSRQPKYLRHKFSQYRKDYSRSFVFVTKKSLRFKYAKYGEVITRGKLRKTLAKLFK